MPDDIVAAPSAASLPAPDTAVTGTALATSASTTGTPAPDTATSDAPQGPIPFDRHKAILDGAYGERDTARREFEEYKARHGWADRVDPAEFNQLQRWSTAYREDPVKWMAETISELRRAYPHLTPALTSEAARILGGARGLHATPEPEIEPDIPVLDQQGNVVSQAFSADRVKQYVTRAVAEALGREVAPLKKSVEDQQASVVAQRERAASIADADAVYKQAEQWHGFAEHKPAIAKAFHAHPDWSLQDAYLHVLHTEILPKFDQASQTKLLTQLKTQAAGGSVRPDGAGQAKPDFKGDFRKALEYYDTHPEEASALAQR